MLARDATHSGRPHARTGRGVRVDVAGKARPCLRSRNSKPIPSAMISQVPKRLAVTTASRAARLYSRFNNTNRNVQRVTRALIADKFVPRTSVAISSRDASFLKSMIDAWPPGARTRWISLSALTGWLKSDSAEFPDPSTAERPCRSGHRDRQCRFRLSALRGGRHDTCAHAAAGPFGSAPVICRSRCSSSIGNGKTMVEFFSAAISVSVCR